MTIKSKGYMLLAKAVWILYEEGTINLADAYKMAGELANKYLLFSENNEYTKFLISATTGKGIKNV